MPTTDGDIPSDAHLLVASASGDKQAFTLLVRRHQAAVHRLARSISRSDAEAEEAMQEAFIAAYRGASTWVGEGSVRGWLLTLTRNASFRHRRRRSGEPPAFDSFDDLGERAGWGQQPLPDELLSRLRTRETVRQLLMRLPEGEREVLVLRELDGLSGDETAAVLGLSLSATKSRLHRARLRLASYVREEMTDA